MRKRYYLRTTRPDKVSVTDFDGNVLCECLDRSRSSLYHIGDGGFGTDRPYPVCMDLDQDLGMPMLDLSSGFAPLVHRREEFGLETLDDYVSAASGDGFEIVDEDGNRVEDVDALVSHVRSLSGPRKKHRRCAWRVSRGDDGLDYVDYGVR